MQGRRATNSIACWMKQPPTINPFSLLDRDLTPSLSVRKIGTRYKKRCIFSRFPACANRLLRGWPRPLTIARKNPAGDALEGRRIIIQHRLVYQVIADENVVKILRMWTHYE